MAPHVDAPVASDDPHTVLGVQPNASEEDVRAAYEEARSRYDPKLVAHLGYDVQQHYKAKARALDHAYRSLSG